MGASEQQCHLNCLLFGVLGYFSNVDGQLTQLTYVVLIDEIRLFMVGFIENYTHYGLSGSHWAVNFCMHFID